MKKEHSDTTAFHVHAHELKLDHNGIENFFWPLNHNEIRDFASELMVNLSSFLVQFDGDKADADIYRLGLKYFTSDACGLYQSALLKKRFEQHNLRAIAPEDWPNYAKVFAGQAPDSPLFLSKMRTPHKKHSFFNRLKFSKRKIGLIKQLCTQSVAAKGQLNIDGLLVKPITKSVLEKNIISTQRTELIKKHAKLEDNDVVYCSSLKWFENIDKAEYAAVKKETKIKQFFMETLEKLFLEKGVDFPQNYKDFFSSYLDQLFGVLYIHYNRLFQKDLPQKIWTGTGGNIWDMMLRLAVMKQGGSATGYDHGGGTGHVNLEMLGIVEMWGCDKFITFNQTQATKLTAGLDIWPLLTNSPPIIEGVSTKKNCQPIATFSKFENAGEKINNIILASTIYDCDTGRILTLYSDIMYTDWQARLIGKLKGWKFDVFFKPHPESRILPHPALGKELEVKTIHERFEDIVEQGDLLILDYTFTSIFLSALKTNIPIVIIDFDGLEWFPGTRELAEKRCSIVEAIIDEDNRVNVNWDKVFRAIEEAQQKSNNHDFVKTFYL